MAIRKGISQLISYAIIVGIVLAAVSIVVSVAGPVLDSSRDTAAIENARTSMTDLDDTIRAIASQANDTSTSFRLSFRRGGYTVDPAADLVRYEIDTSTSFRLSFRRGGYTVDPAADLVRYEIDTDSRAVAPGSSRRFGNLRIYANLTDRGNRVRLELNYTDIDITGRQRSLGPGMYTLRITSRGVSDGRAVVRVGGG